MIILNIAMFLVLFGTLILVGLPRSTSLLTGVLAFCAAVGVLVGISYVVSLGVGNISVGLAPRIQLSLFLAAAVEEVCKYIGAILKRDNEALRIPHGWGVGLGFAGAEHLFFLLLSPPMFALRLVLVTALHVGTTALYTRKKTHLHRLITDGFTVIAGSTIHGLYNFLLQGLDPTPLFW